MRTRRSEPRIIRDTLPAWGVLLFLAAAAPLSAGESLEIGEWQSPSWSNEITIEEVELDRGARGNHGMRLSFKGGAKDKAVAVRKVSLSLSGNDEISFSLFSPTKRKLEIAVAVTTGDKLAYFESKSRTVQAGTWAEMAIPLGRKDWKSEASNWKHESELRDRNDIRELLLLIYNLKNSGEIFIDELTAGPAKVRPKPKPKNETKPTAVASADPKTSSKVIEPGIEPGIGPGPATEPKPADGDGKAAKIEKPTAKNTVAAPPPPVEKGSWLANGYKRLGPYAGMLAFFAFMVVASIITFWVLSRPEPEDL
jgi:hypothetical protein